MAGHFPTGGWTPPNIAGFWGKLPFPNAEIAIVTGKKLTVVTCKHEEEQTAPHSEVDLLLRKLLHADSSSVVVGFPQDKVPLEISVGLVHVWQGQEVLAAKVVNT
ncbi:hypothetical protein GGTG_13379 [Gaeumannomyces tritici R3-111a-1]|uniref:Uncharacterized protein n=1 Tax=Gaeumannomyces tritici (strain R3-111a-1) TaxID=644352 RepID=J3PIQ0_GAET3|nr:hypothetical protein GGTG_13379 [Gaeumannomyces tritici R3-111a-1]EJT69111.1 hypothetical protein GGTG_13379 [Gaeumannomyces tritici R3-111a-1]